MKSSSDGPSAYAEGFRAGELAALDEFADRFKVKLTEIQGRALGKTIYSVANDITAAAGTIIKEMRDERE